MKMVLKARFEPATTFFIEKKKLSGDLEDFKLFAVATLNLSKETVKRYARAFKIFQSPMHIHSHSYTREMENCLNTARQRFVNNHNNNYFDRK
jgi:hypothetical protein